MDYSSRAPSPSDLEKQAHLSGKTNNSRTNVSVLARESSAASSSVGSKFDRSVCQPIRRFEEKCGMESRGIERVKEEDCHEASAWGSMTVWLSADCVLPTLGIGILGPQIFGLGLGDSMLTIAFVNLASVCLPAFMATFGVQLGLRQMTQSRYAWGWYGAKVVALLNCIACIGWSTVNSIAGAQTLRVVANNSISHAVGVVIIGILTLVLGLFGYKVVHQYERYAWIPTAITFLVLLGCAAPHLVNTPMGTGTSEAAGVLSFMGTIFGFAAGWTSLASDFNVYQPPTTPTSKTFGLTYFGICLPLILVEWLGAALMCAAKAPENSAWMDALDKDEIGGLVGAVFFPKISRGGGGFFMVLLVLSVIANNIINVYSLGLSISVVSNFLSRLPRILWPIIITAIYIPIAIVGGNSFATSLTTFMDCLGYWLAIFVAVVLEEHFIFKRGRFENYDAENTWNDKSLLPIGWGALAAFCAGAVGAAMGMSQLWYSGPVASKIGPMGADIGFELSGAFSAVVFPIARYYEIRYTGR